MKRKSDLLREVERLLFWEHLIHRCADVELMYLCWKNRQTAKELARRGVL